MNYMKKRLSAAALTAALLCGMTLPAFAVTPAAKIGTVSYVSLNAALQAVKDGETITLQSDISGETETYAVGTGNGAAYQSSDSAALSFTLDLNGYTISSKTDGQPGLRIQIGKQAGERSIRIQNGTISASGASACGIEIYDAAASTKTAVTLDQVTIQASGEAGVQCINASLDIRLANITGQSDAIYAENAELSLRAGSFQAEGTDTGGDGAIAAYVWQDEDHLIWSPDTIEIEAMAMRPSDWTSVPASSITAIYFTDVAETDYFYLAVLWAAGNGITSGTSQTTFAPNAGCTRAQAVVFLWNAAGQPQPESTSVPFTDVKTGSWYETAVCWAYENGITAGTSKTTFSPNEICTRAQIVTLLWNLYQKPAPPSSGNPFTDVKTGSWYETAVRWAYENGITAGTSAKTFSPNIACTRAEIVTFLYRAMA